MEVHFILTVLLVAATVDICKPDTAPLTAPEDLQTAATGWSSQPSGGGCSSGSCGGGGWGSSGSSGGCSTCGGGGGWQRPRPRPSCGGGCGGGCDTQQYNIKVKVTKHKRDLRNRQFKPTESGKPLL